MNRGNNGVGSPVTVSSIATVPILMDGLVYLAMTVQEILPTSWQRKLAARHLAGLQATSSAEMGALSVTTPWSAVQLR